MQENELIKKTPTTSKTIAMVAEEAIKIVEAKSIFYISNKCIKQEYQRLFLKVNPVFTALKN